MRSVLQVLVGVIAIVGAGVILYQFVAISYVIVNLWSAKELAIGGFVLVFAFSAIICGVFTASAGIRSTRGASPFRRIPPIC